MSERLELIDRSQRCEFCRVLAHIHHAPDCPDPDFLAAHPADSAEETLDTSGTCGHDSRQADCPICAAYASQTSDGTE